MSTVQEPLMNFSGYKPASPSVQLRQASEKMADLFLASGKYNSCQDLLKMSINQRAPQRSFQSLEGKSGQQLCEILMREVGSNHNKYTQDYSFGSAGGIVITDLTNQMLAVIQEDYNQNIFAPTFLDRMFPDRGVIAETIDFDVVAAPGGLIDSYTYGSPVPQRKRLGNRTITYKGSAYRNYIQFEEYEILFMRQLGKQPFDTRGILQRVAYNILKMRTLMYNRKQLIKATIFDGSVTIDPNGGPAYTVDYQIPTWNVVTNITAQTWGTYNTTTGSLTINPLADPMFDIVYYLNAYEPWFTRHGRLNRCTLVMNPITQLMITRNDNVRQSLVTLQTAVGSPVAPQTQYTVSNIVKSLITGFEGDVVIEGAAYLTNDSDISWNNDQQFTATAPPQNYFVPVGKVFFYVQPLDYPLGNFIYQPQIQHGGLDNPQPGEWVIAQPLIGPQFPEGLQRPTLNIVGGFQGGLAPVHVEDVLIGDFGTVTS